MGKNKKLESCIKKVKKKGKVNPYGVCKASVLGTKFNKTQLNKGIKIEFEHTNNKKVAMMIAMDHLRENKNYYKRVKLNKKGYVEKLISVKKK